ncbi:MAG: dUTP diphosphatase, partial [Kiritimatiellae bacterium]|nr:dUTP diphosphatase [Kiritimatiellia bacterium]
YMPERAHDTDAGFDLRMMGDSDCVVIIPSGGNYAFDTGVHMELPHGCYGKIEGKSGLNFNHDIVSCGGVIDEGYTGSVAVKLYNLGKESYMFRGGDKIAQLIIQPYITPELELADKLEQTERGSNGFGSTGR